MLKIIAIAVIVIIVAILIYAATRPDTFRVERSATINSTPEKVFPHINDLRNWAAWSTWEKMDPNMKRIYSASTSGKGATYEWEGNSKVGKGRMTIADSVAPSRVVIGLDFYMPFAAHNTAEISLQAQGGGTRVTWAMYGPSPYISKLFGVFISMDKMIGKDFEDSLEGLRSVTERS